MKNFFFVFALAACGGGGGDGGGGGAAAAAFAEDQIRDFCDKGFECMSSFPQDMGFEFEDFFGASSAECFANFGPDGTDKADLQASVDAGRVIFDSADASVCANELQTASCDQFWNDDAPPECDTALTGTVADGGTCTIDFDCVGEDSFCDEETNVCGPL